MAPSSGAAYVAGLRSAVAAVAKAKHVARPQVERRVNARGELVIAVLLPADLPSDVSDGVRTGLEALAAKDDGARVSTKQSPRAGKVVALIVPPVIAGQWSSLDPSWRPAPPPSSCRASVQCLTCHEPIATPDYLALLAVGWTPESPHLLPSSSGWRCPTCSSKLRARAKRYRR